MHARQDGGDRKVGACWCWRRCRLDQPSQKWPRPRCCIAVYAGWVTNGATTKAGRVGLCQVVVQQKENPFRPRGKYDARASGSDVRPGQPQQRPPRRVKPSLFLQPWQEARTEGVRSSRLLSDLSIPRQKRGRLLADHDAKSLLAAKLGGTDGARANIIDSPAGTRLPDIPTLQFARLLPEPDRRGEPRVGDVMQNGLHNEACMHPATLASVLAT